jgi:hypothetical protein
MNNFIVYFLGVICAVCTNVAVGTDQWLPRDAFPARRTFDPARVRPILNNSTIRYNGVFTEDPAVIGRLLVRPSAPFVPLEMSGLPEYELLEQSRQIQIEESGLPEYELFEQLQQTPTLRRNSVRACRIQHGK